MPAAAGSEMAQLVCSRPQCRIVLMCASHLIASPPPPPVPILYHISTRSPSAVTRGFQSVSAAASCGTVATFLRRWVGRVVSPVCRYPRGARQVQCSVCNTINCALAVHPLLCHLRSQPIAEGAHKTRMHSLSAPLAFKILSHWW